MINLCSTKFEISTFTHYNDIKVDEKCKIWSGLGLAVTQGYQQRSIPFSIRL